MAGFIVGLGARAAMALAPRALLRAGADIAGQAVVGASLSVFLTN